MAVATELCEHKKLRREANQIRAHFNEFWAMQGPIMM